MGLKDKLLTHKILLLLRAHNCLHRSSFIFQKKKEENSYYVYKYLKMRQEIQRTKRKGIFFYYYNCQACLKRQICQNCQKYLKRQICQNWGGWE